MTTTFKLRKVELQREGYSPDLVHGDPLFVVDPAAGAYVPLTADALARLGIAPFNPESWRCASNRAPNERALRANSAPIWPGS